MKARLVPLVALVFLVGLGSYLAGMWTTHKAWWPWQKLDEIRAAWKSYRRTGLFLPEDSYALRRPDAADGRHVIHDPQRAARGFWAVNRLDAQTGMHVFELWNDAGELVSTFPIDHSRVLDGGRPDEFAHIATLLPDGSVLVVWDDAPGMARLDPCGNPIWTRTDRIYHHSIERGVDGYWTWGSAIWNGGEDQKMIRFDPQTGDILEELDLIDDVILKSPENALALKVPEGFAFDRTTRYGDRADIFHPNDLEELLPEMAAAFPMFEAGDLLISNRNIDQVAVIGRRDGRVKWSAYGPWHRQHDPDFLPDGTIGVFSNNTDRFRSSIIVVDPATGKARDRFHGTGVRFDSFIMGKHQVLPNGNWLIVSSMQGRVIELAPDGTIVREYNNLIDDRYNAIVPYAEFLPVGTMADVAVCGQDGKAKAIQ